MPFYAYRGFDARGKPVRGNRDAESPRAVKQLLRREGIFVTELRETGGAPAAGKKTPSVVSHLRERVSAQELALATRQLATLVGAGIPLVESLVALIDQIERPLFKAVWADVKQRVNEGAGLGDALGAHPRIFSDLYVNMVRAGESSGALDVVLERLADFTEAQAELRAKVVGTMVYPALMLVMASGVTAILFAFVIPKISKIFEAQRVALPLPTQILIGVSHIVQGYWYVLILLGVLTVWGFRRFVRSERGRARWDAFVLRVPLAGPLLRMIAITRFARTLGTLIGSGVPLLAAFDIVKNVVQNTVLVHVIEDAREGVKEGESIAAPLKRSGEFPAMVTHMIAIGERSGQLESMLGNIARSYEVQVDARLRAMTSLLEPLMIVLMGVVVGFIVFSILLPMLQISSFA